MEKLTAILSELHPDIDFSTQTGLIDQGILDSFDIVTIVAEVEAEFGTVIPAQALIPENFNSAEAIFHLIRQLAEA